MLPKVVIVGRPNVGKSSLLNMLAGRLVSIVDPTPGVTRDRVSTIARLSIDPAPDPQQTGETGHRSTGGRHKRKEEEVHELPPDPDDDGLLEIGDEDDQWESDEGDSRGNSESEIRNSKFDIRNSRRPSRNARSKGPTRAIEVIDTGGYGIQDTQNLTAEVERQIGLGLKQADLVLFVIDAQTGIVALDQEFARLLRRRTGPIQTAAPILLVANKVDSRKQEPGAAEASRLGLGEPIMVSAATGYNKDVLIKTMLTQLPEEGQGDPGPDLGMLLAIVGKRNAGKSTLVNALAGEERMIVSELEGTTRDSVDVRFEYDGRVFTAIDTAGVRRSKSLAGDIEYYSQHRALRAIRRADVVLLLIDATVPISHVDHQLGEEIVKHYKPAVVVVNKWDLAESRVNKGLTSQDDFVDYLDKHLAGLDYAPVAFISASQGEGIRDVVAMSLNLHQQAGHRVSTSELNQTVNQIITERPPTSGIGRQAKIYYMTQAGVYPPTITIFVNDPSMFDAGYQRYLINRFRERLPFAEVPIRLVIKGRSRTVTPKRGGRTSGGKE